MLPRGNTERGPCYPKETPRQRNEMRLSFWRPGGAPVGEADALPGWDYGRRRLQPFARGGPDARVLV